MPKFMDLTGQKYGRLTVLNRASDYIKKSGKKIVRWHCKCDCGNEVDVIASDLRSGHTQSCGCYMIDRTKETSATHGKTNTRLYNVWSNMRERCYCPTLPTYPRYGGRGIKMCDEWHNSYLVFEQWALNNGYNENAPRGECTIDRIDVDGNYCPENCRWVNQKAQMSNVSYNHYETLNGITHTVAEWADIYGLPYQMLEGRLCRGIPIERAILDKDLRYKENN